MVEEYVLAGFQILGNQASPCTLTFVHEIDLELFGTWHARVLCFAIKPTPCLGHVRRSKLD